MDKNLHDIFQVRHPPNRQYEGEELKRLLKMLAVVNEIGGHYNALIEQIHFRYADRPDPKSLLDIIRQSVEPPQATGARLCPGCMKLAADMMMDCAKEMQAFADALPTFGKEYDT